jgi:hypothetical protein
MTTSTGDNGAPYTVAIVAMGPSYLDYLKECTAKSGRFQVADETWAVNAMGGIIQHDRLFMMDALPYFAKVAKKDNPALIGYGDWLHKHQGPIYTQREYEGFPGSVPYPLEAVLNSINYPYLNNTTAYALAFAIHLKVRHIKLYGMDFTYANNRGFAEAGRACIEHWVRDAVWRGIKVTIAPSSTLMDQCNDRQLYGYSTPPIITKDENGYHVSFADT